VWFGDALAAKASAIFDARGLLSCNRAVPTADGQEFKYVALYEKAATGMSPYTPGFTQFHFTTNEDVSEVDYAQVDFYTSGAVKVDFFLNAASPVLFAFNGTKVSTAAPQMVETGSGNIVDDGGSDATYTHYRVYLTEPTAADWFNGDYYLALGNKSTGGGGAFSMDSGVTYLYYLTFTLHKGDRACTANGMCNTCEKCTDSVCTAIVSECASDTDCASEQTCSASVCGNVCKAIPVDGDVDSEVDNDSEAAPECVSDEDCTACHSCNASGACVATTPMCTGNSDCTSDTFCDTSKCGGTCVIVVVDGDQDADSDNTILVTTTKSKGCSSNGGGLSAALFFALFGLLGLRRRGLAR